MTLTTRSGATALALIGGLALAACAEQRPASTPSVDQASAAYNRVASDPRAAQAAHDEVEASRDALTMARQAWQDQEDQAVVDHYAYLSSQHAAIATAQTRQRAAADRIAATTPAIHDMARVVTLPEVMFGHGRANLNAEGRKAVDDLAAFMKQHPDRRIEVSGYTDNQGSDKFNVDLSARRANAVREALVADGVDDTRIVTRGMGPDNPVASNNTNAGRQQNRRVEIVVLGTPPAGMTAAGGYGGTR